MAALYTFKIRGLTSGSATINTVDVTYDTDGILRFTDSNGVARSIPINPASGEGFARLIFEIFTGASGLDAGSSGVQGHRVFGEPRIAQ